jgi:outer membrane cobalamin receptor
MRPGIILLTILVAYSLTGVAQRKDTTILKEVVIHAERIFDKETAGGKETHVDSLVLKENINHTLSELLSENTSVFIKAYGRGSMATASFRGTAPSHTQVLWNGMSINSPMLGMVDFSLLPVYFIDDLSLKHGGASTEDIGGALGGSISINNKPDWNNKLSARYVQGVGSFSTTEEFTQVDFGKRTFQSKTRAYYTHSRNDFPFINDSDIQKPRVRNRNAAYTMYSAMQELYGMIGSRDLLSAKAWYHSAERSIPKLNSNASPDDTNINLQTDKTWRVHSAWDHHYANGAITTSVGLNDQHLDYYLYNNINGQGLDAAIYSISRATSWVSRAQLRHDFSSYSSFTFSANYNIHSVHTSDSVKKTGYETDRKELLLYAGYHQNFFDRLNIRASLRQDRVADTFIPLIPYVGFDFKVWKDRPFFLKGNVTRNYHVPTLNDLYWQPGGNPLLRPEQGITQELTMVYVHKTKHAALESQLTGFYSDITDWILWVPNFKGYWEPHNVKKVLSRGIEFSAKSTFLLGQFRLTVNGGYAFTRSTNEGETTAPGDKSQGKQLMYIPIHSGNAFFNIRYKSYSLTWQHNAYSKRFTTSSNNRDPNADLPDYFMNQVYVTKEFAWKQLAFETQLKVYNLFDEYYRSVLGRRMPGRNCMLLLMIRYRK